MEALQMKKIQLFYIVSIGLLLVVILVQYMNISIPIVMDAYYAGYTVPYGQSHYTETKDEIMISLEKVVQEKYYITYSWVTGNESYLGITLLVENIKKNPLNKEFFKTIYLMDNEGKKYRPIPYFEILDFPADQPLLWKQKINAKFEPLPNRISEIDIYIYYGDNVYVMNDVLL
jgi:hypothetical protein